MLQELRTSFGLFIFFMILLGFAYPFAMMGVGQQLFPKQANGSLIEIDGMIIGSKLIGQNFVDGQYFHGRPSAAGNGYDAANSSGTNLGPTSFDLMKDVRKRVDDLKQEDNPFPVPVDLVTSSGSGLDPDISVAAARFEASRIAAQRHLSMAQMEDLIRQQTTPRDWGFLGESRVNVLALNRALDHLSPVSAP